MQERSHPHAPHRSARSFSPPRSSRRSPRPPPPAARTPASMLVAYSTPKTVLGKIIQAWQKTPRRRRRLVQPVVRRLHRPGARGRDRPQGRPRLPLDRRRRQPARRQRASSTRSGTAVLQRHRRRHRSSSSPSATATRRTSRAGPTCVKPGIQVVTPNPFSSGSAKWNVLAAYGAQRRLGKTDKQATAYVAEALQARRLAGHVGPQRDEHVPRRQGRRPAHLRERGDQLAPQRPGHPVRDPAPDDADRAADRGR